MKKGFVNTKIPMYKNLKKINVDKNKLQAN
jgi:hypothetical protein